MTEEPQSVASRNVTFRVQVTPEGQRAEVRGSLDDTIGELADRVGLGPGSRWSVDGRTVAAAATIDEAALLDGTSMGPKGSTAPLRFEPGGQVILRVVGGPGAGAWTVLPRGTHDLGRGVRLGEVVLDDPEISRAHARLEVRADGSIQITDLGSRNGTTVNDGLVTGPAVIAPTDVVQLGATVLLIGRLDHESLTPVRNGAGLEVNRRFRVPPPSWDKEVIQPRPPEVAERPGLNVALTLAPAALMGGMAVAIGRPEFAAFAVMSPILGFGRTAQQRSAWKKKNRREALAYEAARGEATERLARARRLEASGLREMQPDLASLAITAQAVGRRLWERSPTDPDFLRVRIGLGPRASEIKVGTPKDASEPELLAAVPHSVDLLTAGNMAVVGARDIEPVVQAMLLQLAITHSPGHVRLLLVGDGLATTWSWFGWLPHARWNRDDPFTLTGTDPISIGLRLAELRHVIKQRQADAGRGFKDQRYLPVVVVVLVGATRLLRSGFAEVLRDGPPVGVHAICVDPDQVPEHCRASVRLELGSDTDVAIEQQGLPRAPGILADQASPELAELLSRALAPLRPMGDAEDATLPTSLRLLELLGTGGLSSRDVMDSWARTSPSSSAPVGRATEGAVELDLTRHGPHALIAGTTRSGKSEFIKTLVASFALANHPDDLQFLFIDFKGGGDYQLLKELPHAVDLSTSEDLGDFARNLRLLAAEITRRRKVLTAAETTTIEGYQTARRTNPSLPPLGRLVVIVDEFAELASQAQDQLEKLVSVARTGAAFGVHLVLATQRPSGAVTGQIDANVALRVCFRVARDTDSIDVIGDDAAAAISERHRGRAFFRAHNDPLREMQTARVAGARPGSVSARQPLQVVIRTWEQEGLVPPAERPDEVPDPDTDLFDVLQAIREAASSSGWRRSAVPWPKPLPDAVGLAELPDPPPGVVAAALVDDPTAQRRQAAGPVLPGGHLAVGGSARSGRTTALRSVAVAAALCRPASDLHLYVLDFAGGSLRPLVALPHFGGGAFDDWEQASRLLGGLTAAVTDRLRLLGERGLAGFEEQRALDPEPWPHLLLLVDGWDVVNDEGQRYDLPDQVIQLLGRGAAAGLTAAIAGDRTVGLGRIGRVVAQRWALRFNDPNDYSTMGVAARDVPKADMPPGRLLDVGEGRIGQVALVDDVAGAGQAGAVRRVGEELAARDRAARHRWPRRVEPLPASVATARLLELSAPPPDMERPLLFGLSGDTSQPLWVDLAASGGSAFVGGPPDSGRTTALRSMAEALLAAGVAIALVSPKASSLLELAGRPGVVAALSRSDARAIDPSAIQGASVVVIDDAEMLDSGHQAHSALAGGHLGCALVLATTTDTLTGAPTGWLAAAKRSRCGLLLSPRTKFDGAVFGTMLPEAQLFNGPRGRAVAGVQGVTQIVQIGAV